MSDELNIKDIINKTNNFDQPYAPQIPEGIHEVEVTSFEDGFSKDNHYRMLTITVTDKQDRIARVTSMLELQWIEGTIRLIKGLFSHNAEESEKQEAKDKINKYFESAKDEADLQDKCIKILEKLVSKGCIGWLKVEFNPNKLSSKYPDKALYAYEPTWRWKTNLDKVDDIIASGTPTNAPDNIFEN